MAKTSVRLRVLSICYFALGAFALYIVGVLKLPALALYLTLGLFSALGLITWNKAKIYAVAEAEAEERSTETPAAQRSEVFDRDA